MSYTKSHLDTLVDEIKKDDGEAASSPLPSYAYNDVLSLFDTVRAHGWGNGKAELCGALDNAGAAAFKIFPDVPEQDLATLLASAFAFARGSVCTELRAAQRSLQVFASFCVRIEPRIRPRDCLH